MFTTANLAIILMCRAQITFYLYIFLLKIIKMKIEALASPNIIVQPIITRVRDTLCTTSNREQTDKPSGDQCKAACKRIEKVEEPGV